MISIQTSIRACACYMSHINNLLRVNVTIILIIIIIYNLRLSKLLLLQHYTLKVFQVFAKKMK